MEIRDLIIELDTISVILGMENPITHRINNLVKRLKDENEWRPMESAPKDGTEILVCQWDKKTLYDPEEVYVMQVRWEVINSLYPKMGKGWCMGMEQDEQGGHEVADNPIGWTPLPEIPKELIPKTKEI